MDARIKKAAKILVDYSTRVKKGEVVQIITDPLAKELALELYRLCLIKGAYPVIHASLPGAARIYYKNATKEQLEHFPEVSWYEIQKTDVVFFIGGSENTKDLAGIDPKKIVMRQKAVHKIQEYRVNKTRWVIYYFPTNALAQEANMSLEEFTDFVFRSTNIDWAKESKKQDKLKKILDNGKKVRIIAKDTDIRFSISGRLGIKCDGKHNMPDGEVFTTPVENSTEGHVKFSFPAISSGQEVEGIYLEFKKGKVVKATAEKNQNLLLAKLDTDKGSRTLGEFGVGVNYNIKKFVKNTLFDEKIGGTIHLALGSCYPETKGKNRSAIHWDLVLDLRKKGELYIDGKLIQKNGRFLF